MLENIMARLPLPVRSFHPSSRSASDTRTRKENISRRTIPRKQLSCNHTQHTCSEMYKYTVFFTVWLDLLPPLNLQSVISFLCVYICDGLCVHGHMFTYTNTSLTHPPHRKPDVCFSSCMMWKAVAAHPDVSMATGLHLVDRAG